MSDETRAGSWQMSVTPVLGSDFPAELESVRVDPHPSASVPISDTFPDLHPDVAAQVEATKAIVRDAIATGHFGDPATTHFHATINGHANAGHDIENAEVNERNNEHAVGDYVHIAIKQYEEV